MVNIIKDSELNERIKSLPGAGISMRKFADVSGVSYSTLRKILSGSRPSIDIAHRLAKAGNVSLEWLISGKGPKNRSPKIDLPGQLANGLAHAMKRYNIPADQLMETTGIKEQTLHDMLKGKTPVPDITDIRAVADAMRITLFELLDYDCFKAVHRQLAILAETAKTNPMSAMQNAMRDIYPQFETPKNLAMQLGITSEELLGAPPRQELVDRAAEALRRLNPEERQRLLDEADKIDHRDR